MQTLRAAIWLVVLFILALTLAAHAEEGASRSKGLSMDLVLPRFGFAVGKDCVVKVRITNQTSKPISAPVFHGSNLLARLQHTLGREGIVSGGRLGFGGSPRSGDIVTFHPGKIREFYFHIVPRQAGKASLFGWFCNNRSKMLVETEVEELLKPGDNARSRYIAKKKIKIDNVWTGVLTRNVPVEVKPNPKTITDLRKHLNAKRLSAVERSKNIERGEGKHFSSQHGLELEVVLKQGGLVAGRKDTLKIALRNTTRQPMTMPAWRYLNLHLWLNYSNLDTLENRRSGSKTPTQPGDLITIRPGEAREFAFDVRPLYSGKALLTATFSNRTRNVHVRVSESQLVRKDPELRAIVSRTEKRPIENVWTGVLHCKIPVEVGKPADPRLTIVGSTTLGKIEDVLDEVSGRLAEQLIALDALSIHRDELSMGLLRKFVKKKPPHRPLRTYACCQLAAVAAQGLLPDFPAELISVALDRREDSETRQTIIKCMGLIASSKTLKAEHMGNFVVHRVTDKCRTRVTATLQELAKREDDPLLSVAKELLGMVLNRRSR